jgi:hypothetical protein
LILHRSESVRWLVANYSCTVGRYEADRGDFAAHKIDLRESSHRQCSCRRNRDFRVFRKFTRQPVNEHPHTQRELPPVRIEERYRRRRGSMLRKHFDESAGRKIFGNVIMRHLNEAKS